MITDNTGLGKRIREAFNERAEVLSSPGLKYFKGRGSQTFVHTAVTQELLSVNKDLILGAGFGCIFV